LTGTPHPERVTPENYKKLHLDMTLQQVEAILGPRGYDEHDDPWDSSSPMQLVWENRRTGVVIKLVFEKYPPQPGTKVKSTSMHTP
jgi:hypothetical protein